MSGNSHEAPQSVTTKSNSTSAQQITRTDDNFSKTQISNSLSPNQHKSIISLSKLKNYMPQNRVVTKLISCSSSVKSNQVLPSLACYGNSLDLSANPSQYLHNSNNSYNRERLARAASSYSTLNASATGFESHRKNSLTQAITSASHHQSVANQVVAVTQQEYHQQQQHLRRSITDFRRMNCSASLIPAKNTKGVESSEAKVSVEGCKGEQSEQSPLTNREERKRKKIDSVDLLDDQSTSNEKDNNIKTKRHQGNSETHKSVGCDSVSYSKHNMTPSSLLLLQNHNYIEQQQRQQRNIGGDYDDDDTSDLKNLTQERRGADISCIGQSRTIVAIENCPGGGSVGRGAIKRSDDHSTLSQSSIESSSTLSSSATTNNNLSSSSSLMLTNINQFKVSDSNGNSSINNGNNGGGAVSGTNTTTTNSSNNNNNILTPTSSANNVIASSDYHQDLSQIHNQRLSEADILAASSINSLQQNYQQSLANSNLKQASSGGGGAQFYSAPNIRTSGSITGYHPANFSPALEHQINLESSQSSGRNNFEENSSILTEQNGSTQTGSHINVDSLTVARDLAHHQARTAGIHQYYNSNYNLMPTSSSKSSSPTSSASTPSPKTTIMHSNNNTSQHSNHIITSSSAVGTNSSPSPQIHLNHLNQHYVNNSSGTTNGLNHHQHHQVSHHYAGYNQQATDAATQHHLTMSNHDQAFAHHHHLQHQQQQQQQQQHNQQQQQQHHHHQQHQHHHHQQQQEQHHQQQQHHQHHNIHSQQSLYHQLANNPNHIYGNTGSSAHYQNHLQNTSAVHQHSNHLMSGAHQSQLNSAAAACAAVAAVSQTLKTVANQHNQQHHYGGPIAGGFGATSTGSLMNMTAQHHQQFHNVNSLNQHHHLGNLTSTPQEQSQDLPVNHATSIVTRKYQCKMCPQVFMSKAELKYHNQNHMREAKPYKCLQCPKAFANSSYLSQHMRIHQGVKPYTCDICSRKFTQLSHLQQHKRTHTGDKPYKCNYMNCTKQFSQLSNLQSHSRCHQLDKPYKCNSCYKCFHDERSLLEHIPRHLESKHLKKNLCIFCGSSYQQERGLVKHFQQYHTDKTPTLVAAAIAAGTTGNAGLIASLVSSTPSNTFATPSNGSSSSSSSSSNGSISSSGSLSAHNNLSVTHGSSSAVTFVGGSHTALQY